MDAEHFAATVIGQTQPVMTTEPSITAVALQYGVVGVIALIFAYVIIILWNKNNTKDKEMADERRAWAEERQKLRDENTRCVAQCATEKETLKAVYEIKHREILEGYSHQLREVKDANATHLKEEREANRRREDDIRKEAATLIADISAGAEKNGEALVAMLQKFLDKAVNH